MKYCYVAYISPAGPGAAFYRGAKHPLHKEEMQTFSTSLARRIGVAAGIICQWTDIVFTSVIDLDAEVAASHFPHDFPVDAAPPEA